MSRLVRRLLLSVVLAGLAPSVALAEWRRAESAHFIVYSDGTERNLRDYTTRLERFHSLLTVRYGGGTSDEIRKLPVYLVGNDRDLRVAQPRLPDGIAGYYTASENDVFAILIRGRDDDLLLHEYSHHFMAQAQGGQGRYPGWLNEGFAEYYATATVSERGKATFGMPGAWRMQNLQQNRWLPMDQVLRAKGSFDIQERNARNMYYAQSWALTHWLLADQNRARALGAYLNAVAHGGEPVEAWQATFGMTPEVLTEQLRAYVRGRLFFSELDIPAISPEMTVTRLPASWDAVILPLINARSRNPDEIDGPALLQTARTNAARFPDDALALTALGRAEFAWGDKGAARTALSRAVEQDPAQVEALLLLAEALKDQSEESSDEAEGNQLRRQAQTHLARALDADPSDYRVYAALAELRRGEESYPTDNDLMTWAMAVRYAPQVMAHRGNGAIAMMEGGRYDEAATMLIPIINDPHGGPNVNWARRLLGEVERRRGSSAEPDADTEADPED